MRMATKRKNPAAVELGKRGGLKRAKTMKPEQRRAISAKGGLNAWASMSVEERSAEMKRRAAKRKKKGRPRRTGL